MYYTKLFSLVKAYIFTVKNTVLGHCQNTDDFLLLTIAKRVRVNCDILSYCSAHEQ